MDILALVFVHWEERKMSYSFQWDVMESIVWNKSRRYQIADFEFQEEYPIYLASKSLALPLQYV